MIAVPFHRYRRVFAGRFHVTVLLLAYRMPPWKRKAKAKEGNDNTKKRKTGDDESSGSNEASAVETREPIRPAVPNDP